MRWILDSTKFMAREIGRKNTLLVKSNTKGKILVCEEGVSFWGGIDPKNGQIIDQHHPNHGELISDRFVLMPVSRGSCSGSGVLLQLARSGLAPAALVFRDQEDILTLGSIIAAKLFNCPVAVLRLCCEAYDLLSTASVAEIKNDTLYYLNRCLKLNVVNTKSLDLTEIDQNILKGNHGEAKKIAMEVICLMAAMQGANKLIDVSRAHIDGCILAHDANLDFAEKMFELGAKTTIPTTMNAISVDKENWQSHQMPYEFGIKANRLADMYIKMGAQPTFTCAPYLLDNPPGRNEDIAWSESNAVVFANSVLGARTQKHGDYLDLCIAITGRAPRTGVYLNENRMPSCEILVTLPENFDDALWPMLGWLAGIKSPNAIPILTGLELISSTNDDLKALCATFGTTSAAPMLHVNGHTPESKMIRPSHSKHLKITVTDLRNLWKKFNVGSSQIDLVAIGSPHASFIECQKFAHFLEGNETARTTKTVITVGRETLSEIKDEGIFRQLECAGVQVMSDICWCSMTEPFFPQNSTSFMTNSGKYAHYGKGLSGRNVRFGSLRDCATASITGQTFQGLPDWLI